MYSCTLYTLQAFAYTCRSTCVYVYMYKWCLVEIERVVQGRAHITLLLILINFHKLLQRTSKDYHKSFWYFQSPTLNFFSSRDCQIPADWKLARSIVRVCFCRCSRAGAWSCSWSALPASLVSSHGCSGSAHTPTTGCSETQQWLTCRLLIWNYLSRSKRLLL